LLGNAKYSFQDELSSRPERSGAEGSAVGPSGFPNSGVLTQELLAEFASQKLLDRTMAAAWATVRSWGIGLKP